MPKLPFFAKVFAAYTTARKASSDTIVEATPADLPTTPKILATYSVYSSCWSQNLVFTLVLLSKNCLTLTPTSLSLLAPRSSKTYVGLTSFLQMCGCLVGVSVQ